jgi:hypothetical protein
MSLSNDTQPQDSKPKKSFASFKSMKREKARQTGNAGIEMEVDEDAKIKQEVAQMQKETIESGNLFQDKVLVKLMRRIVVIDHFKFFPRLT